MDSKLVAMKSGSKDPVSLSYKGRNSFYQPRNKPRGRLKGSCFRCGQYGHYKYNCLKLGARTNPPGAEAKKRPQEQSASWSNGPRETGSNQSQRRTNQEGKNLNDSLGLHNHNVRCHRVGIKPLKVVMEGRKERTRRCQIDQMKLRDQAGSQGQAGLQFSWAEQNKSRPVRPCPEMSCRCE